MIHYTMTWQKIKCIQLCQFSRKIELCCQFTVEKEERSITKTIRKFNCKACFVPKPYYMILYLPRDTCLMLELTYFHNTFLQFLPHGSPHQPILPKCWVIRLLFIVMHQGIQSLLFHGASVILIIPTVDSQIFKKHGKNIGENINSFNKKDFCSDVVDLQ